MTTVLPQRFVDLMLSRTDAPARSNPRSPWRLGLSSPTHRPRSVAAWMIVMAGVVGLHAAHAEAASNAGDPPAEAAPFILKPPPPGLPECPRLSPAATPVAGPRPTAPTSASGPYPFPAPWSGPGISCERPGSGLCIRQQPPTAPTSATVSTLRGEELDPTDIGDQTTVVAGDDETDSELGAPVMEAPAAEEMATVWTEFRAELSTAASAIPPCSPGRPHTWCASIWRNIVSGHHLLLPSDCAKSGSWADGIMLQ